MKKSGIILLLMFLLSGCVSHGASINLQNGFKQQAQNSMNQLIYRQAKAAMDARAEESYSILVEPVSGQVMTLIKEKNQDVVKIIVHGNGYTQWLQIFEDRILCLTGDDGNVHAELKNDFLTEEVKTMIECAVSPVDLVVNRDFQRVSGAEEGSLQIATDNIDYWMKVSADQMMEQVRLYFSDLPMMTLTYSNEIPVFPQIQLEDYPTYKEYFTLNDEILQEKGFDENQERISDDIVEQITYDEKQFDFKYSRTSSDSTIQLVFHEFVLRGFYTDETTGAFCEAVLIGNEADDDELKCGTKETSLLQQVFEQLKKEFK